MPIRLARRRGAVAPSDPANEDRNVQAVELDRSTSPASEHRQIPAESQLYGVALRSEISHDTLDTMETDLPCSALPSPKSMQEEVAQPAIGPLWFIQAEFWKMVCCAKANTLVPNRPIAVVKPLARRTVSMSDVWFEGDLWKLNGDADDPTDLMNWRRRFFMLCWNENLGLVLDYMSEKSDGRRKLGCILQGRGNAEVTITTLGSVAVSVHATERMRFENSIQMYDIAVHRPGFCEVPKISLPSSLERAVLHGVDKHGQPKTICLGWTEPSALTEWLQTLKAAVSSHSRGNLQS